MRDFNYIEVPRGLEDSILKRIAMERKKKAQISLITLGTLSLASFLGLIKTSLLLWQGFKQTGFYDYMSLIFSEGGTLTNYWKEFAFSLIESLPLIGLISLLAIMAIFIWSGSKAIRDARFVLLQT